MTETVCPEHLAALNIKESQYVKLNQLRSKTSDLLASSDDFYLIRWLRARQFDVNKAEQMLRKSKAWREKNGTDDLLTKWVCPEVIAKYDIGGQCGFTKTGEPFWVYRCANLDTKGMQCSVNLRAMLKQYARKLELSYKIFEDQSKKLNKRVNKTIVIMDMEDFGWSDIFKPGMDIILRILRMIEANYPESLDKAYVVNASAVFPMIFNICKPFIHEETRKRVNILGGNWKEKLLEIIDASELPVHWGGTRTDPETGDQYCSTLVRMGGTIPEEYYLRGEDLVDPSLMKTAEIGAGSCGEITYSVEKAKVGLRYTFWTDSNDIQFSVMRKNTDGSLEEVVRPNKYNCDIVPEDGQIQCKEPATYVLQFDNSYSWFSSKTVHYAIQIVDTEQLADSPRV